MGEDEEVGQTLGRDLADRPLDPLRVRELALLVERQHPERETRHLVRHENLPGR